MVAPQGPWPLRERKAFQVVDFLFEKRSLAGEENNVVRGVETSMLPTRPLRTTNLSAL